MRKLSLLAAAGLVAVSGGASAASVVSGPEGVVAPGQTIVSDFDTVTSTPTGSGFQIFTSSVEGQGASVNGSNYLAVLSGGNAAYNFATALLSFSFDIGTPDTYNSLTLGFTDGTSQVFGEGGTAFGVTGDSRLNFVADDGRRISSVSFGSSQNSFEIDNIAVTAVPEPAAWALMILGVGAVGGSLRRRQRTAVRFA